MWDNLSRSIARAIGRTSPPPEPGELAPLADPTRAGVEAWIRANLDVDGWSYVDFGPHFARFMRVGELGPVFQVWLRIERFTTASDRIGRWYRSVRMTIDVDVRAGQHRFAELVSFRRNNLQESYGPDTTPPDEWKSLAEMRDAFFARIHELCARQGGAPAEGPASFFDEDVQPWLAQAVLPGEDVYAYADELGATLVSAGSISGGRNAAMTLRVEFYRPMDGCRSQLGRIELDAKRRRMRQLDLRGYAEHNLSGAVVYDIRLNRWVQAGTSLTDEQFDRLCELARAG